MSDYITSTVYHRILTCRLIGKQQFKITSSMFIFDLYEIILLYVAFLITLYYIHFSSVFTVLKFGF
jgi:hypothetical protein